MSKFFPILQNKLVLILICLFSLAILTFLLLPIWISKPKPIDNSNQILVTTSFFPLFDFTDNIARNLIKVQNMTPTGIDPHEFEPTAQNLEQIYNSKLFIYQGAGFDTWADKIASQIKTENSQVSVLNMTSNFELVREREENSPTDSQGQIDSSIPEEITYNPHIWLDPVKAIGQSEIIRDNLIRIDPKNQENYTQNTKNYVEKLQKLDQKYQNELISCQQKIIIAPHDAYIYLAERYGFQTLPIAGLEPTSEPTSQEIAQIIEIIKSQKLKYIFYESAISPKLAETIASETGAKTLILDSIESPNLEQIKNGENYLTLMEKNLQNLKIALECNN